jgi:hypothetical protein
VCVGLGEVWAEWGSAGADGLCESWRCAWGVSGELMRGEVVAGYLVGRGSPVRGCTSYRYILVVALSRAYTSGTTRDANNVALRVVNSMRETEGIGVSIHRLRQGRCGRGGQSGARGGVSIQDRKGL